MTVRRLTLTPIAGSFAVCRLESGSPIPRWATDGAFVNITRTPCELSIVCEESAVPFGVKHEPGWICFQLRGPFAFAEVGVLAALVGPLAAAGISVFAVSTFDTDYLMVKAESEAAARAALTAAGHIIES
jgi:uncharacterized protein